MTLSAEQKKIRLDGITASEVSSILGCNPFKGPYAVFAEKRGLTIGGEVDDEKPPLAIRLGNIVESMIATLYEEETGEVLETKAEADKRGTLRHPTEPWFMATPDRFVKTAPKRLVEIKWVGWRMASGWNSSVVDGVPDYVNLQAQAQMYVAGAEDVDVPVILDGSVFHIFRVSRSAPVINVMVERCRSFWADVQRNVAPPPDDSEESRKLILAMHPRPTKPDLDPASPTEAELIESLLERKEQIKALASSIDRDQNRLRELIGDRMGVFGDFGKATLNSRAGGVLWKSIAESLIAKHHEDLVALSNEYKAQPSRILLVKPSKKKAEE